MSSAPEPAVAALCDKYLQQWSREHTPATRIIRFLNDHSAGGQDQRLTVELIKADIEATWSDWAAWIETQAKQETKVEELLSAWSALPRIQNFAALFKNAEDMGIYWSELANVESQSRDRWGDAVGPVFYEHHFQVKTDELTRRPRRHLRCCFESNDDFSEVLFPLRGLNEVGRQRTRDPHPYFFEPKPEGNRIVVASRFEAEVSREQLSLQLLSPAVAVVTNRSTVNAIRILPLDLVIPCEQRVVLFFPFTIQIPGRQLHCY